MNYEQSGASTRSNEQGNPKNDDRCRDTTATKSCGVAMEEAWMRIKEWEEYEVSERGQVRRNGKMIASFLNNHGYPCFNVSRGAQRKMLRVHREVAQCFVAPFSGAHVRHLNGNKVDCAYTNLAWGTALENEADKRLHGRSLAGERHHQAKLRIAQIEEIRTSSEKPFELARKFGVRYQTIWSIQNNHSWRVEA